MRCLEDQSLFSYIRGRSEFELLMTYVTRFCVHSRSRFTSFAAFIPSAKLARVPLRRRWASACSSSNSRCLAFNSPDLVLFSMVSSLSVPKYFRSDLMN